MFLSLICRPLFPRALRLLISRISAFREYSVFFVEDERTHKCFVQTWDEHCWMSVCVWVEPSGQHAPKAELAGLSGVVDSTTSCQLPLACHGGSPTLLRILSDSRVDSRKFVMFREFSEAVFLHCFRLAYQEVFGGLEVTTMIDFLILRLRGALQESWFDDWPVLRRSVIAGRVLFPDLCDVVKDLLSVWVLMQNFVRDSAPHHIKTEAGRVSYFSLFVVAWYSAI